MVILKVSTLGGCGSLERTGVLLFLLWEGCGGLARNDFEQVSTFLRV